MTMSRMRWFRILAAAGAILLGAAGAGSAKPLLQEDFKAPKGVTGGARVVTHGGTSAWRGEGGDHPKDKGGFLSYDLTPNVEQGTVEFDLTRNEAYWGETPFSLGDENGNRLLAFRIEWPDKERQRTLVHLIATGTPATFLASKGKGKAVVDGVYLKSNINRGKTVHFAVTWGPAGTMIYVNGHALDFDVRYPALLPALLKRTRKVIVGGELFAPRPGTVYGTTRSLLANFQVHDVQLPPSELGQPILTGLGIASVDHNASRAAGFSGKLVAGDKLKVEVGGTAGVAGSFDVLPYPDIKGTIALDWRGWGVYLEDKAFFAEGEVNLRDVNGYRVYASTSRLGTITADTVPVETLKIGRAHV
jgi:hypothetical protein